MGVAVGAASRNILLHLLLLLSTHCHGCSARSLSENHGEKFMDHRLSGFPKIDDDGHAHGHGMSHMDHLMMDPQSMIFFTLDDLKPGKTMPIYFPKRDPSSSPRFLPREEAESIPFSSGALPHLLDRFSFSTDSPQAKAMEDTLKHCETKPVKGETKSCATSLESMLDFVHGILGGKSPRFRAISTSHLIGSSTRFQNFTIQEAPRGVPASKMVACHTLPYPYAVFYCHSQESENKVFEVVLAGENGDRVKAVAVCHLDTSQWNRDHPSFRVLGIEPGTLPVCHFFPADNLVWVPIAPALSMV
ncbi:BURP domain-containing protein [Psidium guajava]|nr:BURP domain-containing protein [Psidium guajava]